MGREKRCVLTARILTSPFELTIMNAKVDVEIQRNAFGPGTNETILKRFDPAHVNIRSAVRGLLSAAGEAAEHIFADVEHVAE